MHYNYIEVEYTILSYCQSEAEMKLLLVMLVCVLYLFGDECCAATVTINNAVFVCNTLASDSPVMSGIRCTNNIGCPTAPLSVSDPADIINLSQISYTTRANGFCRNVITSYMGTEDITINGYTVGVEVLTAGVSVTYTGADGTSNLMPFTTVLVNTRPC